MKPTCTAYTKEHENIHEVLSNHLKTACEAIHESLQEQTTTNTSQTHECN